MLPKRQMRRKKVVELEREKALNDLQASVTGLAMTAAANCCQSRAARKMTENATRHF